MCRKCPEKVGGQGTMETGSSPSLVLEWIKQGHQASYMNCFQGKHSGGNNKIYTILRVRDGPCYEKMKLPRIYWGLCSPYCNPGLPILNPKTYVQILSAIWSMAELSSLLPSLHWSSPGHTSVYSYLIIPISDYTPTVITPLAPTFLERRRICLKNQNHPQHLAQYFAFNLSSIKMNEWMMNDSGVVGRPGD